MARMGDRERLRGFYEDLWAKRADRENQARLGFQRELIDRALDRLGEVKGKTVVEIGPGAGEETRAIVGRGASVVAVDLTTGSLRRTVAATSGRALPVQAVAEELPLRSGAVDRVFTQTVLMHLDLEAAAREWARVLRPGGSVVSLEPLAGNPLVSLYRRTVSPYRRTRPRYVTLERLRQAARGLEVAVAEPCYLLETLALLLPVRAPRLRSLLAAADRFLFRLPGLSRLAWMIVVVLEKPRVAPD